MKIRYSIKKALQPVGPLGLLVAGTIIANLLQGCAGMGGKECLDCLATQVQVDSGNLIKVQSLGSTVLSNSVATGSLSREEGLEQLQNSDSPMVSALGHFRAQIEGSYATSTTELPFDFDRKIFDKVCEGTSGSSSDSTTYIDACVKKIVTVDLTPNAKKLEEAIVKKLTESGDSNAKTLAAQCFGDSKTSSNDECRTKIEGQIKSNFLKKFTKSAVAANDTKQSALLAACTPKLDTLISAMTNSKGQTTSSILTKLINEAAKCDLNLIDNLCFGGQDSKNATETSVKLGDVSQFLGCAIYSVALPTRACGLADDSGKVVSGADTALINRFASGGTGLTGCSIKSDKLGGISDADLDATGINKEMQKSLVWMCGIEKNADGVYARKDVGEFGVGAVCDSYVSNLNSAQTGSAMTTLMGSLLK